MRAPSARAEGREETPGGAGSVVAAIVSLLQPAIADHAVKPSAQGRSGREFGEDMSDAIRIADTK